LDKRMIEPETLYQYKWVSDSNIANSNHKVAYALKEISPDQQSYHSHIRVVSIDGTEDISVTSGVHDFEPKWSPDGKQLAFIRMDGSKRNLWLIPAIGDEPRLLIEVKRGIGSWEWSFDGTKIAYTSKISLDVELEALSVEAAQKLQQQQGQAYSREAITSEGSGWWDGLYTGLFIFDLEVGTSTALATGAYHVTLPRWSFDSKQIAFLVQADKNDPIHGQNLKNGLYAIALAEQAIQQVVDHQYTIEQFDWSQQGESIAFVGHDKQYGSGTQNKLYIVDVSENPKITALSSEDVQLGNYVLNDMTTGLTTHQLIQGELPSVNQGSEGGTWFTLVTRHGETQIWGWKQNESGQQVTKHPWVVHQFAMTKDNQTFVVNAIDANGPAELYAIDVETGSTIQLTRWNDELRSGQVISIPQSLWFENRIGQHLQGWIMMPPEQSNNELVPLVLVIHGGPHAMYSPAYCHEFQTLAATGVALLFINPRGSFGYGQSVAKACRGDVGNGDYEDLMDAVDATLQRYSTLDRNRLGVMGGSYGGLMTNWIVGQTNRFKAAISQRSISNWISFCGMSDIGGTYTEGMLGANLWNNPEHLWDRSPVKYAPQVTTPILIMHGEGDMRCPIEQSDQWYTHLKRLGKQTKLIRYADSNHAFQKLGKPALRIDVVKQVNNWFSQYLSS